jgi:periplasmic protein TonB
MMKNEDYKGLGVSLGVHVVLLLLFALVASTPEPQQLGMVEVEFGPFELAQPAARAETPRPPPAQIRPEPQPQRPTPAPQPRRTEPVDLPTRRDATEPERVPPPRPQPTPPQPQTQAQPQRPTAQPAERDETGGTPEGRDGTTSATGEIGDAAARRAPFNIDGLDNRNLLASPLPRNPGARGTSVIRVCVAPDGAVRNPIPAIRSGTPALDNAALAAVRQWRFNPLPPAAPQNEQCGRVTFTFTLN